MPLFRVANVIDKLPAEVGELVATHSTEMDRTSLQGTTRAEAMQKVRDQLAGGDAATSHRYHPDQHGLTQEQQTRFRETLRRSHVNLVEPALDRLVNSIHSGRIRRRVEKSLVATQEIVAARAHASAMSRLCENAFAYGTGYLVPLWAETRMRYWSPDPLATTLATSPHDIDDVLGVFEVLRRGIGGKHIVRYVTKNFRGWTSDEAGDDGEYVEHGLGFVPAVIARGRDRRHYGEVYGRSLVIGVAEATIRVTNNEVNLELLRDKQTQALLVVKGSPSRTSTDDQGSTQKYIQFPMDGGDADYKTPESRLEQVIEVTRRFCEDAAISSGLPLDTFLPSLIAGSDASATAARIRAFPLQQRMARLVRDWEAVEEEAILMCAAVSMESRYGSRYSREELEEMVAPEVTIIPSMPESESETLASWQQKTANFMAPIEDAIEYYSEHVDDEGRKALADKWRIANDPGRPDPEPGILTINELRSRLGLDPVPWGDRTTVELEQEPKAREHREAVLRDVLRTLFQGSDTAMTMAELTDLKALLEAAGLPTEAPAGVPEAGQDATPIPIGADS